MKICSIALLPPAVAFSASSSFSGRRVAIVRPPVATTAHRSMHMYDNSRDPPSSPEHNAWQVLSKTEEWISSTLASATTSSGTNPYTRKEIAYACETHSESAMVVANIFRRLKEVREMGEHHGADQENKAKEMGEAYEPSTLRQTQVVVIPGHKDLYRFATFDGLIEAINEARRNARDYVTDVALDKLDEEDEIDWSVSVNCAHLHPEFGQITPEEELEQLKAEEEAGEVDVNLLEYKEKRLQARRSPYPTIVIEVRSVPPPDFGSTPAPTAARASTEGVSSADVAKLEALFGKSAHVSDRSEEDAFYSAIGESLQEVSSLTPIALAQQWIAANDPDVTGSVAAFTESSSAHVDAAYEFIFTNIAMMREAVADQRHRQYMVLPHFLSSSATSFDRFGTEVRKILDVLPDLRERVELETFHPEHIDRQRRSPMPIYVLEWKQE